MCRPKNLQPSLVGHAKPRSSAAGRGQGLAHPRQPRLAPAEPPGKPSPRRLQRAGEVARRSGPEDGGKVESPPLPPRPCHATVPNQPLFSVVLALPSVLCSDPGTPRGTPAQMERKEGSETRARKEPPRLPAIAQTPRSCAGDMPRGLRARTDQVA